MTNFDYKARDKYGVLATGILDAENEQAASKALEEQGLTPVSVSLRETASFGLNKFFSRFEKVSLQELIVFVKQLSAVLDSGVPLLEGLQAISEQIKSTNFQETILNIKKDVEQGSSFSEALQKYPKIFSSLIVNMVRAGEKAGILVEVLERLGDLLEKELVNYKTIKAATSYPMYVVMSLISGFLVVVTWVIPKFSSIFSSFKTALPLPTRILIGINYAIVTFWPIILLSGIILFYLFRKSLQSDIGRLQWDRFILSTPIIGPIVTRLLLARFFNILSAMLASGITMVEALNISSAIVGNKVIAQVIDGIRDEVIEGKTLSVPMKEAKLFPPIAIQMVAIGERSGKLSEMLNKVSVYFDRETSYAIANLTTLIEPILIFCMGLLVLFLALGVFLPMWSMMQLF